MSLDLFGGGECGHWPQQQIGMALWALSTTGHRWQKTGDLMRLSVLPDDAVLRNPHWVAPMLFALRGAPAASLVRAARVPRAPGVP